MPETWDSYALLMSNYSVPAADTTYHCKFFEIPHEFTDPTHMIRFDAVNQEGNEGTVHHMLLFWCTDFDEEYVGFEADCNGMLFVVVMCCVVRVVHVSGIMCVVCVVGVCL